MRQSVVGYGAEAKTHTKPPSSPPAPSMTLIVNSGAPSVELKQRIAALQKSTDSGRTEIIVACDAPWPDAPDGVRIAVSSPSSSRGDRFDRAAERAEGELIAFLDAGVHPTDGWQDRAFHIFSDASVGAAGGPQVLLGDGNYRQRASWSMLSSRVGSGPFCYRFSRRPRRPVAEMPTTNLIVRRSAFEGVGGFQCPSPLGDDARLCYKVRTLARLRVIYDPGLAVGALPPALFGPLLSLVASWGRQRGDLARRLPETTRNVGFVLPPVGLLAAILSLAASPFSSLARLGLVLVASAYFLAGLWITGRATEWRAGVLASIGLPLMHLAYAFSFLRGYVGNSLGEASPNGGRRRHLRILIFNWRDITHPWAGGAETYMHELARRWVSSGCEVGWISERYRTGKRVEVIDGIRFQRVGGQLTLYPLAALAYLWRLRNRYDVLIDCENGIPFFTPLYSRKPSILVVFHVHSEVFRLELPLYLRWLAQWLEGWLMRRVYRHRALVTISPSTFTQLVARGYEAHRIAVVTPGIDVMKSAASAERSKQPLLIYVGRLKRYKGVDVLLRALPRVLLRFPETRLSIVGQGPDRERLERLAWSLGLAASVRFHGYLEKDAKNQLLAAAWVSVCPSAFEGWGVVCLEANASGVPVVAARVPGLTDVVLDGVTGTLVPFGDSVLLADSLVSLLSDSSRRQMMGVAGQTWAAKHNWERSAAAFLEAISAHLAKEQVNDGLTPTPNLPNWVHRD